MYCNFSDCGCKSTSAPAKPVITASLSELSTATANAYQWNKDGVAITGATSKSFKATENGVYTVTITSENGCESTSDAYSLTNVGVADIKGKIDVVIYPNPMADQLNVDSPEMGSAVMFDASGRMVLSSSIEKGKN